MGYEIEILINPCKDFVKTGERGEKCCYDSNLAACQDDPVIQAGDDIQLAYFQNAHISTCVGTPFAGDPNCGTYLEVHRKHGSPEQKTRVLADVKLEDEFTDGFRTVY